MISIVIPLYNKASYIEKCINSVLNQSFSNFEIIVVNDGSTDNGQDIVEKMVDSRITLISQKNSGVSIARNRGVAEAKFNFAAFLDADDWWHTDFLEEMIKVIKEYPEAGMYASNYKIVNNAQTFSSSIILNLYFKKGYFNYIESFYKNGISPIWTSAVIVNNSKFKGIGGFNPKLRYGEDLEFWLRMSVNYRIVYLDKPLSYYNYDVNPNERAITNKTPPKESFFIFNLDYFLSFEQKNIELKKLLDLLRLKYLKPYYLAGIYPEKVYYILSNVIYYPVKFKLFYLLPRFFVKLLSKLKCLFERDCVIV